MPPTAGRKKPVGRVTTRDSPTADEPSQSTVDQEDQPEPLFGDQTPILSTENTDIQDQLNQTIANTLGAPVTLTDSQLKMVLERLARTIPNLTGPVTEEPLPQQQKQHNTQRPYIGHQSDPENSLSDSSLNRSHHSRQSQLQRPHRSSRRQARQSPKHDDPDKLDDGTSLTYSAWKSLLRGKLRANADWWPTEQDRINYVFSRTTGEAQQHLDPRIDEDSLDPWLTVDEMLEFLDTVYRDYYEAERADNAFHQLEQHKGQEFNEFHTEFARLASVGRVPTSTWRSQLWRKLNKEYYNRLLATHHQYPTYQSLVRECQRLSVDLAELYHRFPAEQSQRYHTGTIATPKPSAS